MNANMGVLLHNHPAGVPDPSSEDLKITRIFVELGNKLELPIMDHIIVSGDGRYTSLREQHSHVWS